MKLTGGKHLRTIFLVLFSFLLGCMLTINLTPIEKTCRIEDTDREYNIMRNSKLKNPELIILILSAPKNLDKRDTIRETWVNLYDKKQEDWDQKAFKIKHYFVLGSAGLTADELLHLSSEQSKNSDILILPILDSYKTLTEKVKRSFVWLNEQYDYGLGFKYVLKCDDDSFVNLKTLPEEIVNVERFYLGANSKYHLRPEEEQLNSFISINAQMNNKNEEVVNLQLYWGYFSGGAKIKTRGKWKEKDWFASDKYIPYALGGGYILSKNLVSHIAKNADNLRSYGSEDVSVGLWLTPVNNVLRIHDARFDTEWTSRGCRNTHLITHNISCQEMRDMYNNYFKTETFCPKEVHKRSYYIYDWKVPPSQCCQTFAESIIRLKKQ